jgi:hypothetical protein
MRKSSIARISYAALATAICALASLAVPASSAAAATPPSIEGESVSHVTPTDATLEAQINPGGLETSYEFRFETISCWEENLLATCESAGKGEIGGTIPVGSSTHMVSIDVSRAWHDLSPSTYYAYSVHATNSAGEASGSVKTFETAGALPPAIESESVSNITPTDATLEATIDTEGLATIYTFYLHREGPSCLKADPPCMIPEQAPIPLPSGKLLGSFVGQSVSADLNSVGVSLSPGGSYEYWVTATSAAGTAEGPKHTFTAPSASQAEPQSTSLDEPSGSVDRQTSAAIQSPVSGLAAHRRHHHARRHRRRHRRAHKRRHLRVALHRASRAG